MTTNCGSLVSTRLRTTGEKVAQTGDPPSAGRGWIFGAGAEAISAKTIAGFESPSGPVSKQRDRKAACESAGGPVTIASTLPAGGSKTWLIDRLRIEGSWEAKGLPSSASTCEDT